MIAYGMCKSYSCIKHSKYNTWTYLPHVLLLHTLLTKTHITVISTITSTTPAATHLGALIPWERICLDELFVLSLCSRRWPFGWTARHERESERAREREREGGRMGNRQRRSRRTSGRVKPLSLAYIFDLTWPALTQPTWGWENRFLSSTQIPPSLRGIHNL